MSHTEGAKLRNDDGDDLGAHVLEEGDGFAALGDDARLRVVEPLQGVKAGRQD